MRKINLIITIIMINSNAWGNDASLPIVTFPGGEKMLISPNKNLSLSLYDPGENENGFHLYSLKLKQHHKSFDIVQFQRSVTAAWSSDSRSFYATNFIGSNTTDCIAVLNADGDPEIFSMTNLLSGHKIPGGNWSRSNSHYYVRCVGWNSPHILEFKLDAVADNGQVNTYKYIFKVEKDPHVVHEN